MLGAFPRGAVPNPADSLVASMHATEASLHPSQVRMPGPGHGRACVDHLHALESTKYSGVLAGGPAQL